MPLDVGSIASYHWRVSLRTNTSLVALTVLICEYFTTLHVEVALIWRSPISFAKCMFVVCRYVGLITQTTTQVFFFIVDPEVSISRSQCIAWHMSQTVAFLILFFAVESIQATKIRALYSGNHATVVALHAVRISAFAVLIYTTLPAVFLLEYDGACLMTGVPRRVAWLGGTAIATQVFISALTLSPKVIRDTWRQSSWIAIMTRDSVFTFSAIIGISAIMISHAEVLSHIIPTCFITILSISGCRMITNILSTVNDADNEGRMMWTESDIQLTTILSGTSIEDGLSVLEQK